MIENIDYVLCRICQQTFPRINAMHLKRHAITVADYLVKFPGSVLICEASKKKVSESVVSGNSAHKDKLANQEEYGIACVICNQKMNRISPTHLKKHAMTMESYKFKYPDAPMESQQYRDRLSASLIGRVSPHKGRTKESHPYLGEAAILRAASPNNHFRVAMADPEQKKELIDKSHDARNESFAAGNFKMWNDGLTKETDERMKAVSDAQLGKVHSEETIEKISAARRGKTYEQIYGNRAEEMKEMRRDETVRRLASEDGFCKFDTLPERIFEAELVRRGLAYEKQVMVANKRGKVFTVVDFKVGDLYIYVDGDYWHGNPAVFPVPNPSQVKTANADKRSTSGLAAMGIRAVRVWESSVKADVGSVIDALLR